MAYIRRLVAKDATWMRAWTADALVDLVTIANDEIPKRGDEAYVTATSRYYRWMDNDTWYPITGLVDSSGAVTLAGTNAFTGANSFATNVLDLLIGQIKFPATQNPSSNVNTFDDFERGSWTPVDASGAGLTLTASGVYIKFSKAVLIQCTALYPATANGASCAVGGLPFTNSNSFTQQLIDIPGLGTDVFGFINNNSVQLHVYSNAGTRYTNVQLSGRQIISSGFYLATA